MVSAAVTDLVTCAMGYGVMRALEGRGGLLTKLQALPPHSTLVDALVDDVAAFINTRPDLIEALGMSSASAKLTETDAAVES